MHRLWDEQLIDFYQLSYTELTLELCESNKKEKELLAGGNLRAWVYESQELAQKVYASATPGANLRYAYMYRNFSLVKKQLRKGGIRLATVLNDIFG